MTDTVAGLDLAMLRDVVQTGPTPLFVTISGSHLYGFSSPDSDVDLRGAFVAPLRQAIGMKEYPETQVVSQTRDGLELDWVAHDVLKFARLMTRRNGYVLEQLFSPLVVWGGPWLDELREIGAGCIIRHLVHHYRGFARNQRKELAKPDATVKDLIYCYRVLLTGIHVLETGRVEGDLTVLQEAYSVDGVDELIARKRAGAEKARLKDGEPALHEAALDTLLERMADAHAKSTVPEEIPPATRNALDDYVARARMELGQ